MNISVLNLGAGVQSTTIYLMACANRDAFSVCSPIPYPAVGLVDYAVFADTQDEPREVYHHLDWLVSLNGVPILRRTKGRLSEDLKNGVNSTQKMYLHRSCRPLVQIEFNPPPIGKKSQKFLNFSNECLGMCGV